MAREGSGIIGTRVSIDYRQAALCLLAPIAIASFGCATREATRVPPEPTPRSGGTFALVQDVPESLDPVSSDTVQSATVVGQIFDGLVTTDSMMNLAPALAESWRVSDEGRTFAFTLRKGVRFHDGTPLDADDVIFSFERTLLSGGDRESLIRQYMLEIEGAESFASGEANSVRGLAAPDAHTVRITLQHPYMPFLQVLTNEAAAIVPRSTVQAVGDRAFARFPIGTGPFRMVQWTEDGILLESNPDYFGGKPLLDGVAIRFPIDGISDGAAPPADVHAYEPPSDREGPTEPGWVAQRYHELDVGFLGMRVSAAPLDRLWLRRAIAMAIDREAAVATSAERLDVADGFLPPGIVTTLSEGNPIPTDPAAARLLLREHGHSEGVGIAPIPLYFNDSRPRTSRVVQEIAASLAAVGIRVDPKPGDWDHLAEFLLSDRPGMYLMNWLADMNDADSFFRPLFSSEGRDNYMRFHDLEIDRLLVRAVRDPRPSSRHEQYRQVEQRVLDLAPIVPLYHSQRTIVRRTEVAGMNLGPFGLTRLELEKVWLKDRGRS